MKRNNHYDKIAPFYDALAHLVLGKNYQNSKSLFFEKIKPGENILYLGGGTGQEIVSLLEAIGPTGKLVYMEASLKMIRLMETRLPNRLRSRIEILHCADFSHIPDVNFTTVITQYFFDVLADQQIHQLFEAVNKRSNPKTTWIFVDFYPIRERKWLIGLMINAFKILVSHPRKDLPRYDGYFEHYGWRVTAVKEFNKGFIKGKIFQLDG